MAITLNTAGTTGILHRGTGLDYKAAYTILFRYYHPAVTFVGRFLHGVSGATSANGGSNFGAVNDKTLGSGSGYVKLTAGGADAISSVTPTQSTWHGYALVRTSTTNAYIRWKNGSGAAGNICTNNTNIGAREAVYEEFLFYDANNVAGCEAGAKVTNYKSWSRALSDAEIDAEWFTTEVLYPTSIYAATPMSDEASLANNLVDSHGYNFFAGAGLTFGSNDPAVTIWSATPSSVRAERGRAVGRGLARGVY